MASAWLVLSKSPLIFLLLMFSQSKVLRSQACVTYTALIWRLSSCGPDSPGTCDAADSASECCDYRSRSVSFYHFLEPRRSTWLTPTICYNIFSSSFYNSHSGLLSVFFLLEKCLLFPHETLACSMAEFPLALNRGRYTSSI